MSIYFTRFGNQQKERFDVLIYAPHPSINRDFIKKVRETSHRNLDHISDETLYSYLYHEADTGVLEIMESVIKA